MFQGNAIVGQSGGPTSVINASLCGVVQGCFQLVHPDSRIDKVFGMQYGVQGFMEGKVLDFGAIDRDVIDGLKSTPGSALGSCRHKVKDEDFPIILEQLKKLDIRYYFLAGGNDTMDTICRVEQYCKAQGYDLRGIGVPKTVDNDLCVTDHTPGFASAARYVAMSVKQAGVLARDMKKVDQFVVFQTIGRSAGWLPAAAALAKESPEDAPHIILVPEVSFNFDKFIAKAREIYAKYGFVSVVCGEGIKIFEEGQDFEKEGIPVSSLDADGKEIKKEATLDKFGNQELGAMAGESVALHIHAMLTKHLVEGQKSRGEFQITESLPMCAADRTTRRDVDEAWQCGRRAVELALDGQSGVMVTMNRVSNDPYKIEYGTAPLHDVAVGAKPMTADLIDAEDMFVTPKCLEYLRPLVGELPKYVKLF